MNSSNLNLVDFSVWGTW